MSHPAFTIGWVRNLHTAPSSTDAGRIIAIAAAFSGISLICIIVRLVQRWKVFKAIGLDDIAAACSMVLGIGYSINATFQTQWGLGLNAHDFPTVNAVGFSRIQYIGGPIYCLAILGFKVSLLASYMRLAGFNRTYRYTLYAVMALVVTNQLIYTFLLSFACRPIAKQWNPTLEGTCIDQLPTYFGLGGSSLGFDILIILLPFPILRRLQLNLQKKLALGCLFALGFFVSIIQIIRLRTIAKLANYTDSEPIIIWSIVEIHTGVLIACMPSFAPLLKSFGRKVSHSYQSNGQSKRLKVNAEFDSTPQAKRLSKGNAFGSARSADDLESADDEVKLWDTATQRTWPAQVHAWGGSGASHPLSTLHTEDKPEMHEHDEQRITVVREITVRTHHDAP